MIPFHIAVAFFFAMPGAHVRNEFRVTVNLPYEEAFPLFGAWAEQKWAPDWKPRFVYPNPPADQEGAVFVVDHGSHSSVWTLTRFDAASGQVEYVYMMDKLMATRIQIRVKRKEHDKTEVSVVYERTALDPAADEHVKRMGKQDADSGPEWEAALNAYAAKPRSEDNRK